MNELNVGDFAEITGYPTGDSAYRAKLLALGLVRGTVVRLVNVAPLGDPFEIAVRGYHLSLRADEVSVIKVRKLDKKDVR